MKRRKDHFFAVTAPGLEDICAGELLRLGIEEVSPERGGVGFVGEMVDLYRANLWLRTASRVLVRVGEFQVRDFPELYRKTLRQPWGRFLRNDNFLTVKATSHRSRLWHTDRIAATISEAVHRAVGVGTTEGGIEQHILVRLDDDRCVLSVDSSGELLHRRGYREAAVRAPLRETLAAGLLALCSWDGTSPLVDPMCGSGTIPLEGALIAMNRAPGLSRSFAFMRWPRYRPGLWEVLLAEARKSERTSIPLITGYDRDNGAVEAARANALKAGLSAVTTFEKRDISLLSLPPGNGLLLCNPPYGGRLEKGEDLRPLFRKLGEVCRPFSGWTVAFLCPDEAFPKASGLRFERSFPLVNGGIPVRLYVGKV